MLRVKQTTKTKNKYKKAHVTLAENTREHSTSILLKANQHGLRIKITWIHQRIIIAQGGMSYTKISNFIEHPPKTELQFELVLRLGSPRTSKRPDPTTTITVAKVEYQERTTQQLWTGQTKLQDLVELLYNQGPRALEATIMRPTNRRATGSEWCGENMPRTKCRCRSVWTVRAVWYDRYEYLRVLGAAVRETEIVVGGH